MKWILDGRNNVQSNNSCYDYHWLSWEILSPLATQEDSTRFNFFWDWIDTTTLVTFAELGYRYSHPSTKTYILILTIFHSSYSNFSSQLFLLKKQDTKQGWIHWTKGRFSGHFLPRTEIWRCQIWPIIPCLVFPVLGTKIHDPLACWMNWTILSHLHHHKKKPPHDIRSSICTFRND